MTTEKKKTAKPKAKSDLASEPVPHNINAIGTLLSNSYTKQSLALVSEEGPVFGVIRDALPEAIKEQWKGEIFEVWAGLDKEENVFVCAFLDFEIAGVDPLKLAVALLEVSREMGNCYGSFGSLDDKHVTFMVGLPGSSVNAVPATMIADTIAYALNGAAAAKEHLDRVFPPKKSKKQR